MDYADLTEGDRLAVDAMTNFMSWGERPSRKGGELQPCRSVPPAWWAYALGASTWCPPKGEL